MTRASYVSPGSNKQQEKLNFEGPVNRGSITKIAPPGMSNSGGSTSGSMRKNVIASRSGSNNSMSSANKDLKASYSGRNTKKHGE